MGPLSVTQDQSYLFAVRGGRSGCLFRGDARWTWFGLVLFRLFQQRKRSCREPVERLIVYVLKWLGACQPVI